MLNSRFALEHRYTSSNAIAGLISIGCKQPVVDDTVYVSFTQVPSSSEQIVTVQGSGFESFERAQGYEFELSCEIEGTLTNVTTESETLSSSSSDTEILISNVSLASCASRISSDSPYLYLTAMRVLCDSSCDSCIQACPNITLDGEECENSFCDVTLSSSDDLKIATFLTVVDTTTTQSFSDGTNQVTVQGYGFEETSDYDTDYVIVLSTSSCFESTTLTNLSLCDQSALCNDNGLCALCASIDIDLTNCGNSPLSNSSEYEVTASITYGVGDLDHSMSGVIGTVQAVLDTRTTSLLIESSSTRVTLSGTGFINQNASVYEAQFEFMDSVRRDCSLVFMNSTL